MERVMGIEPTWSAWKAEVLPLNYTRRMLAETHQQRILLWFFIYIYIILYFLNIIKLQINGGDSRTRTDDIYLARVALSQLSYIPINGAESRN